MADAPVARGLDRTVTVQAEIPRPDGLTWFVRLAYRWLGGVAHKRMHRHPQLVRKLLKARNPLVPVAYLAQVYLASLTAAVVGLLPLAAFLALGGDFRADARLAFGLLVMPGILAAIMYSYLFLKPDLEIAARKRDLEANLPYALNFMAALSSAGVVPEQLFRVLGAQDVYGEVAREANMIYRDTTLFNHDLVTALHDASRRSPSQQWQEFLEGAVSTITSGGELKVFFLGKAEQFTRDNRRKTKAFLESLGVMAESYVVTAAAAPLFLIVILSVLLLLQPGARPSFYLNLLVLLAMPILHASFLYILRNLRPD